MAAFNKAAASALRKAAGNVGSITGGGEKQVSPTTSDDKKAGQAKWGDMRKKTATSAILGKIVFM